MISDISDLGFSVNLVELPLQHNWASKFPEPTSIQVSRVGLSKYRKTTSKKERNIGLDGTRSPITATNLQVKNVGAHKFAQRAPPED